MKACPLAVKGRELSNEPIRDVLALLLHEISSFYLDPFFAMLEQGLNPCLACPSPHSYHQSISDLEPLFPISIYVLAIMRDKIVLEKVGARTGLELMT